MPKRRERKVLWSPALPPFHKVPDHLQCTLLARRGRPPPGLGGKPRPPRVPTGLRNLQRYQISSWATRFMRSAAAVLIGFCAMEPGVLARPVSSGPGLSVPRRLGDRLPSNAGRGGGEDAAPGGVGPPGSRVVAAPTACLGRAAALFSRLPAHLPGSALQRPSSFAENLGETERPYTTPTRPHPPPP